MVGPWSACGGGSRHFCWLLETPRQDPLIFTFAYGT